ATDIVCIHGLHTFSLSEKTCAHGPFKRDARSVGIEQTSGIARLDVDEATLLGYHVQQGNASVAVGLPNDFEIPRGLIANSFSIDLHSFLSRFVPNEILSNFVPKREVGGCDLVARCGDICFCGGNRTLIAIEKGKRPPHSKYGVVESLADGLQVSGCVECGERESAVRALVTG